MSWALCFSPNEVQSWAQEHKGGPMLRKLGLLNTFLHLLSQPSGFWLLLGLQEVQRLVLESENLWRSLQLNALRCDGLDQIELS